MHQTATLLTALVFAGNVAQAQGYSGTFSAVNPEGKTVTVTLQQGPQGAITGSITNGELTFALSGTVDDGVIEGTATGDGVQLFFEVEIEGEQLLLFLMEPDAQGDPDYERGQEMALMATSQSGRLVDVAGGVGVSGGQVRGAQPANPLGANPLAGNPRGVANPLAAAVDPVPGTYSNGTMTVVLHDGQGQYQGQIIAGQQQWPLSVQLQNGVLEGQFQTADGQFPVTMQVQGSVMVVESGGQSYQLRRQGGQAVAANPLAQPGAPQQNSAQQQGGGGGGAGGLSDGTPLANEWVQFLAGKKLTYMDSYSSGTAGGYSMRQDAYLCSSGEFLYKDESSVSVDVGGAFGNAGGQGQNTGRWRIITQGQMVGVELRYNDGRVEQYQLEYRNGETYVNGQRWFVTAAEICP